MIICELHENSSCKSVMTVFLPKKLLIEAAMLEYSHIISFNLTLTCHCARFKHSIKTKKLQSETGASGGSGKRAE